MRCKEHAWKMMTALRPVSSCRWIRGYGSAKALCQMNEGPEMLQSFELPLHRCSTRASIILKFTSFQLSDFHLSLYVESTALFYFMWIQ